MPAAATFTITAQAGARKRSKPTHSGSASHQGGPTLAPAPSAPSAVGGHGADGTHKQGGGTPPAPPADPRDSAFWAQIAEHRHDRAKGLTDLDASDARARQDADASTRNLIEAHARNLMAAKQAQNSRGLFYSTFAANQNRDLEKAQADQQEQIQRALQDLLSGNQTVRDELGYQYGDGGATNDGQSGADALLEAIARATATSAQTDVAPPAPGNFQGASALAAAPAGGGKHGGGGGHKNGKNGKNGKKK